MRMPRDLRHTRTLTDECPSYHCCINSNGSLNDWNVLLIHMGLIANTIVYIFNRLPGTHGEVLYAARLVIKYGLTVTVILVR